MPPMTQARSEPDEPIRATTYQYAPRHLLYADEEPWCFLADHALSNAVRNRIPPEMRQAWTHLCMNTARGANEESVIPLTRWLAAHGRELGARTPSTLERARAMGMVAYSETLGLSEYELFNAQGNAFDVEVLHVRIGAALREWVRDPANVTRHPWREPRELLASYRDVRRAALSLGVPSEELLVTPFPSDVWAALIHRQLPCPPGQRRRPRSASPVSPAARRGRRT